MAKEFTGRAARLEELRKSRNLTKRELAAILDVSPAAFQGWLDRGISEKALTRVADALNVRREWFDEDTPVEKAQKEAPVKYAQKEAPVKYADEVLPTIDADTVQIVQRFTALTDEERSQLLTILRKLIL